MITPSDLPGQQVARGNYAHVSSLLMGGTAFIAGLLFVSDDAFKDATAIVNSTRSAHWICSLLLGIIVYLTSTIALQTLYRIMFTAFSSALKQHVDENKTDTTFMPSAYETPTDASTK